jgi:hypothetical protein
MKPKQQVDPQRQMQMLNSMMSTLDSKDVDKMTSEERHEYLKGKLHQKMNLTSLARSSKTNKESKLEEMQKKFEEHTEKEKTEQEVISRKKMKIKEKRKRQKEKKRREKELFKTSSANENECSHEEKDNDGDSDYE